MIEFLLGSLFGAVLVSMIYVMYRKNYVYQKNTKNIYPFLEIPISNITFESRRGPLVTLLCDNNTFYLSIDKKEVYIAINGNIQYTKDTDNELEMNYLYNRLVTAFHTEIFINVVDHNGIIVSSNLLKNKENVVDIESYDYIPKLDDILDKISEHGIDSLTKVELDILNKQSEK